MSPDTDPQRGGTRKFPAALSEQRPRAGGLVSGESAEDDERAVLHQRPRGDGAELTCGAAASPTRRRTNAYPPFLCMQNTHDVAIGVTKLWGRTRSRSGYQSQDSMKLQNLGTVTQGALPFEGRVNFANDSNNPLDTGFGYANAALGIFSRFEQQNALYEGRLRLPQQGFLHSGQLEGERQADARPRHAVHASRTAVRHEAAGVELLPRPVVGEPGAAALPAGMRERVGRAGCQRAWRSIRATGASLGAGSSLAIGTIVPNTGVIC